MIGYQVEVIGEQPLQAAFVRFEAVLSDFSPVFEKIGDAFFPLIQQRFDQQGPGWQPLSEKYAKRKAALYGGRTILRATDELYNSFKRHGGEVIERIGPKEAEFGSSNFKGFLHHSGAGRLPVRTIIEITNDQESRFARVAVDVLNEQIREIGFGS